MWHEAGLTTNDKSIILLALKTKYIIIRKYHCIIAFHSPTRQVILKPLYKEYFTSFVRLITWDESPQFGCTCTVLPTANQNAVSYHWTAERTTTDDTNLLDRN